MKSLILFAVLIVVGCQHKSGSYVLVTFGNSEFLPNIAELSHKDVRTSLQKARVCGNYTVQDPTTMTIHPTMVHHATTTHLTSTQHHVTNHEPDEHEYFSFFYDHYSHQMAIRHGQNCYIFTLSSQERTQVHTSTGMRALELKLLALMNFATKTLVQPDVMDTHITRGCGMNVANYYMMS